MSRSTARVLTLLELLQAGGTRTVPDLARRLDVDERTVRRYATHLAELGIPVEARRGRYGGYRLAPGYKLPPLMLTDGEAVAVALGLAAARRFGLLPAEDGEADRALAKVRRVLPAPLSRRLQALLSTMDFTARGRTAEPPGAAVLLELADAATERRTVTFDYTAWDGRASERTLDGYGLVFHTGKWYVTGRDHDRGEVRTFRLDRIARVRRTEGAAYEVPADFDPAAHVIAGIARVRWAHEVAVVLHTTPAEAAERLPASVGRLTAVPGGTRLTARAERLAGMAQMLAGLGWPFTIERPDELRAEVRALADRLRTDADRPAGSPADSPDR